MKKLIVLPIFLLLFIIVLRINPVCAASSGYERYQDDKCEVYLEYFPIVPYDTNFPTASEEFPIKFYVYQDDWYQDIYKHFVSDGFMIEVAFRDDTTEDSDWVEWKRWYPISMDQYGQDITWTLAGGYGPVSVRATVTGPDLEDVLRDYTKYEMVFNDETYIHVGTLDVYYPSNNLWGSTYAEGGGSIGIPNDLAVSHEGNHIKILVKVTLYWINYAIWPDWHEKELFFVLGDDTPATTDCWLTVEEGTVAFGDPYYLTISAGSGGTTNPTPGSYVYDEGTSVTVTASAYSGYTFDHWLLDGATNYNNPIAVTMDSDHDLQAYFSWVNNPPNTPSKPSGLTSVCVGLSYSYSTSTTDPDGDNVKYQFSWGDGSYTTTGYYSSGATASASHSWSSTGYKYVKVRAYDGFAWSGWSSSLTVSVISGGGCPTLLVWNGTGYVDYGVIDIHSPSGEDMVREVPVQAEDVDISNSKAVFKLREGWEGLSYSESVIDQVKLYAVDEGEWRLCPLISAEHSTLGKVLRQLLLSDDYKAQTLLLETIDLTFVVPYQNVQGFTFVIEGYNPGKE